MRHHSWIPIALALLVLTASTLVLRPFATALTASLIMAMATWPLYKPLADRCHCKTFSALLAVLALMALILLPSSWLISILGQQVSDAAQDLMVLHQQGYPTPIWLSQLPWGSQTLSEMWQHFFHQTQTPIISSEILTQAHSMGSLMAKVGRSLLTPLASTFLSLFLLFFWYRDGDAWLEQYKNALRKYQLEMWEEPIGLLTITLRSTVNGTILTSILVGLLLGGTYALLGVPMAALLGVISAVLSMIPFALPILLLGLWLYLLVNASWIVGLKLFIIGFGIMLVADNVVRPSLIKGHTMPFWMILLGILGGIHAFGLLGLFLGPMIMASLMLMWQRLYRI